jgi:hypothetical protein
MLFACAFRNLAKDLASRTWPTVEGKVHSARHGHSYRGIVRLRLAYEYSVHGQRYVGSRYSFGWTAGLAGGAKVHTFVTAHPRGSTLKVHYNPRNPAQALIAPGLSTGNLMVSLRRSCSCSWGRWPWEDDRCTKLLDVGCLTRNEPDRAFAYYEMVSYFIQQFAAFQLSPEDYGVPPNFDPDAELL